MVKDYASLTAAEIVRRIKDGKNKAVEMTETALFLTETAGVRFNAVISICRDKALSQAEEIDRMIAAGHHPPPLAGIPIIIKDNISYTGYPTTCGSRMLEDYVPVYDATCVNRLLQAGAVITAKANMDEFAMGSSNEYSAFGPVTNPACDGFVPGGSSGGSCAAVAAGIVPVALGSDTGGSIRQPAGFCGLVGLKPTYGSVSRFGLVAFASSTDQIGPVARNVSDCALIYEAIAGHDPSDTTSAICTDRSNTAKNVENRERKFRIGVPREYMAEGINPEVKSAITSAIERLARNGHKITDISLPHTEYAVAAYYIIANAEASSNLARYDGVKFGLTRKRDAGLSVTYTATRSDGFGDEVKRRIMLGTFALSAGYYDAYYAKAQKVRCLITADFEKTFEDVDIILSPTSPTAAFRFGEKLDDPLTMYLSDVLTVPASLAGIPAISIPCGKTSDGRPIGLQLAAPAFGEKNLLSIAEEAEKLIGYDNAGS